METPLDTSSDADLGFDSPSKPSSGFSPLNIHTGTSSPDYLKDEDSSISGDSQKVLIPAQKDLRFQERSIPAMGLVAMDLKSKEWEGVKGKGRKRSKAPKSTMAVKAMELETRRQRPELVQEMEAIGMLQSALGE